MSNVKDLSRILADKRKLSVADAEKFMSLMIDVINDGLNNHKLVKVKGLGTFKVTSVSPRESVDVNTGERILIEGRDKISFTPDNAMKELVNRPFSQFETVVINEGVDFGQEEHEDDASLYDSSEDASNNIEETNDGAVGLLDSQKDETTVETDNIEVLEDKVFNHTVEDVASNSIEPETEKLVEHKAELLVYSESEAKTLKVDDTFSEAEHHVESVIERIPEQFDQNSVQDSDEINYNDDDSLTSDELQHVKHATGINKLLIFSIFGLLILLAGVLCYMYNELNERNCRIESLLSRLEERKAIQTPKLTKTAAVKLAPAVKKSTSKTILADKTTKNKEKDGDGKITVADEYAEMNNSDARVRTGAYKIVGVQKTLKVKSGQTLGSISRLYLGPGMECYIEVMNGKTELKEGDLIKIPELKNKRSR